MGQSEIEVAERTDGVVFCAQPGSGDALQFMKAGVMEIPDVVLITKGDMGDLARRAAADLRGAFSLDHRGESVPVAVVSALKGNGISAAFDLMAENICEPGLQPEGLVKRREQAAIWVSSSLAHRYGQEGLSLVSQDVVVNSSPFKLLAAQSARLDLALRSGWERVG